LLSTAGSEKATSSQQDNGFGKTFFVLGIAEEAHPEAWLPGRTAALRQKQLKP
jgi:hypothetical protein